MTTNADPYVDPLIGAACIPVALMIVGAIAKANMMGRRIVIDDWVMGAEFCLLASAIGIAAFIEWLNAAHLVEFQLTEAHINELVAIVVVIVISPWWVYVMVQIGWLVYPSDMRFRRRRWGQHVPYRFVLSVNIVGAIPFVCAATFLLRSWHEPTN